MYQQPSTYGQPAYGASGGGGYGQYPQGNMNGHMAGGMPGGGMHSAMPSNMGGMPANTGMPYGGGTPAPGAYTSPNYDGAQMYGQQPAGYGQPAPGAVAANGGYGAYMGQHTAGVPSMGGGGAPPGVYGGGPGGAPQHGYPMNAQQRPGSTDSTKYKLQKIFNGVDKDGDGRLSEEELRGALINGDYTKFNPETVKLMIKMFDRNGDKSIDFEEFGYLWKYLADWRKLFARFDQDKNDTISFPEFDDAMKAFGYTLSPGFVQNLFAQYSHTNRKTHQRVISFDMFVQCCITVKRMTEAFKQFDTDRDGIVTMEFEQFLTTVMKLR